MINKPSHLFVPMSTMLAGLVLAGCGGGGGSGATETAPTAMAAAAPRAANVQLEGCVVNSEWAGVRDTAVVARTADGRLVGTAFTNAHGVFVVSVPARSTVVVNTASGGPGEIALMTGGGALSVAACLQAEV